MQKSILLGCLAAVLGASLLFFQNCAKPNEINQESNSSSNSSVPGSTSASPQSTGGISASCDPINCYKATFACTGADQVFHVPTSACNNITVKAWGSGGAAPYAAAGAGGFSTALIPAIPGESLTVIAGCMSGYGGGGGSYLGGGTGGGRSAVRRGSIELITAGGGGGGGYGGGTSAGGAGGGAVGQDGYGHGGTQTTGGAGANPGDVAGSYLQGGAGSCGGATDCQLPAGGGGGGYYGGGGAHSGQQWGGGGGGGSGYVPQGGSTVAGVGSAAPMTTDPDYVKGVAVGGSGNGYVTVTCY